MATTPRVYVICDQNCKFEGMTKEQIYAAIVQAVNEGTIGDIDAGFITTVKTINGLPLKFFVGPQATYDALSDEEKENVFAIITNDTTRAGILEAIENLKNSIIALEKAIAETYGNFNNDWQSGRSGNLLYPQLSDAGTYQVRVKVNYIFKFETSALVYWDGESQTIINLPTMYQNTTVAIDVYHYRLVIAADGSTHIQYVKVGTYDKPDGVTSWKEIDYYNYISGDGEEVGNNVSIFYRKIL